MSGALLCMLRVPSQAVTQLVVWLHGTSVQSVAGVRCEDTVVDVADHLGVLKARARSCNSHISDCKQQTFICISSCTV